MNIIIFGPNGSGKGTQSELIKASFDLTHIESGDIFRGHIKGGTKLGIEAKSYIDAGELVPDEITIPMVLETLSDVTSSGWLLDGFPRNVSQAESLLRSLSESNTSLDYIIEIKLERGIAKNRIMGRRLCAKVPNHPNNLFIDAIKPISGKCRVCGSELKVRADDQDEAAINKRHDIYYDVSAGTLAGAKYFIENSSAKHINVDGTQTIEEIKQSLLTQLHR